MVYLGADHAGFKLKEQIKKYLQTQKFEFTDLGSFKLDADDDFPQYSFKVGQAVAKDNKSTGILICGTGFGICIAANKVKGVRAVTIKNLAEAKSARLHNDANIMCFSGWEMKSSLAQKIIRVWLDTKFSNAPRHKRRLAKIKKYES